MKSGQRGYTIIEVLLFLAVSGGLLSIAFVGFRNKQSTTQFSQAMQEIAASIQDTLNDSQRGLFLNKKDTTCDLTGPGGSPNVYSDATTVGKQLAGNLQQDQVCIFLGKVVGFGDAGKPGVFQVYTIVGKRDATLTATKDVLPSVAGALTDEKLLRWGVKVLVKGSPGGKVYTNIIGAINGLDATRQLPVLFTGKSMVTDAAAQVNYLNSAPNYTAPTDPENGRLAVGPAGSFEPAIICFERSDKGQKAQIEIGTGSGQGLSTKLTFDHCDGV